MNVFELFGKIVLDNSGAERSLDKTVGHAKNAESALTKTFKKIGTVIATAFAIDKIKDFGKACTEAYASIAAEESAFAQIMGDYADTAQQKLQAVADKTGVTSTRMTGAMTSLTAKFKGLGYGVDDATTLAADGLLIAADAAAFWDMSLDESMSHLNSFINGSYEGGEAIGLFANDTQMAAYAVEKGIVADAKAWATLDEAMKQATRLDYAKNMQAQSGATGQSAKEAASYANVMANLTEMWRQFQGVIGKPILEKFVLPAMQKLEKFMPVLTESVQNGIDWLSEGFDKIASYFTEVFTEDGVNMEALPKALESMFRDLGAEIPGLLATVGQAIKGAWTNAVWPAIQGLFKAAFGIELPSWEQLKKDIADGWNNKVWPAIKNFFENPLEVILPAWETLKNKIVTGWNETVWPAIKDFFKTAYEIVLPVWETLKTNIVNGWNNTVLPALSGLFEAVFEVKPEDATGAEVGKKLREWWDLVVAAVGDIFKSVFSVNPEDEDGETTAQKIKDWWKSVITFVGNIFRGFFGVDPEDETNVVNRIINWFENVMETVGDVFFANFKLITSLLADDGVPWTEKIQEWWDSILEEIKEYLQAGFDLILPSISDIVARLQSWWNSVLSQIGFNVQVGASVHTSESGTQHGGSVHDSTRFDVDGSHATGLDYVPRDNYIARLHQGEAVLTRNEADVWRSGGDGRVEAILAQMANLLQDIAVNTGADRQMVLDTGALVGQLTPGIDARLGTISNRKGRGK